MNAVVVVAETCKTSHRCKRDLPEVPSGRPNLNPFHLLELSITLKPTSWTPHASRLAGALRLKIGASLC
jgi:hypothetical protein